MTRCFALLAKAYFSHYLGIPLLCWQRIFLFFLVTTATGLAFFFSLYFVNSLAIDIATTGVLLTCYGLGTIFGGISGGKITDKVSPDFVSVISLLLASSCYLLMVTLKNTYIIAITLFVMGFVANSFRTSNNAKTLSLVPSEQKLKVINILAIAYNIGLTLSGVLISFLGKYGFKYIFIGSSFILFASLIYLLILKTINQSLQKGSSTNEALPTIKQSHSRKSPIILVTALGCLLVFGFFIGQLNTTYPIYLSHNFSGLGLKSFGYLFVLNTILVIFLQAPIGNSFPSANKMLIMGIGIFLYGFGYFILNYNFGYYVIAIISCILYTFGEMLFVPRAQLLVYQNGAENKKGQALGTFQTVYSSGLVLGPIIGGFIYQHLGVTMLWNLAGIIGLCCLLFCFYFRKNN